MSANPRNYDFVKELGRGGFGVANLVKRCAGAASVAQIDLYVVKVIDLSNRSDNESLRKRLKLARDEAVILNGMKLRYVVKMYDFYEENNNIFYISMEYCEGGSLKKAIQARRAYFSNNLVERWISQLVATIHYLGIKGILHRDIKADNIFLTKNNQIVKLGDFGVAKQDVVANSLIGTYTHYPPELCSSLNRRYTPASEMWALGVTCYEIMSLKLPFYDVDHQRLFHKIINDHPGELPICYTAKLRDIVCIGMLAKEPESRVSASELYSKEEFIIQALHPQSSDPNSIIAQDQMLPPFGLLDQLASNNSMQKVVHEASFSADRDEPPIARRRLNSSGESKSSSHSQHPPSQSDESIEELAEEVLEACESGDVAKLRECLRKIPQNERLDMATWLRAPNNRIDKYSPLHTAAYHKKFQSFEILWNEFGFGALSKQFDAHQHMPIHTAALNNAATIVRFIVTKDPSQVESYGKLDFFAMKNVDMTFFHMAAAEGSLDVVKEACKMKCSLRIGCSYFSLSPIHIASAHNRKEVVKFLLNRDPQLASLRDDEGSIPLNRAVLGNAKQVAEYFLTEIDQLVGIDLGTRDAKGRTLLHHAAGNGHLKIVEILVEKHNLNPREKSSVDDGEAMPWHHAAGSGNLAVVTYFLGRDKFLLNLLDGNGAHAIHRAASHGALNIVEYFLKDHHVDLNITDKNGRNLLHCAARSENAELVQFLISKDVQADCEDNDGNRPIHDAALNGRFHIVKLLVQHCKIDIFNMDSIVNKCKSTILHRACCSGNVELVRWLVETCQCSIYAEDDEKLYPIHEAAFNGKIECIDYFIEKCGMTVDGTTDDPVFRYTILHSAAQKGHLFLVQRLVEHYHADWKVESDSNISNRLPIEIAASNGHLNVTEYLYNKDPTQIEHWDADGQNFLHNAADAGKAGLEIMVHFLKVLGISDEHAKLIDKNGRTLLHLASASGQLEPVKLLIERYGLDPRSRDHEQCMALHEAAVDGNIEIVEYFLEGPPKLDVHERSLKEGVTSLHAACNGGHIQLAKMLIEKYHADIMIEDSQGVLPIHQAALGGNKEIIEFFNNEPYNIPIDIRDNGTSKGSVIHHATKHLSLIQWLVEERGVDIRSRENGDFHRMPIHIAAQENSRDVVDYFLKRDPTLITACVISREQESGWYPIHYAAMGGALDVIELLLKEPYSMDVNISDDHPRMNATPLHLAATSGKLEAVKLLIETYNANMYLELANVGVLPGALPFHLACSYGHAEVVKYFLQRDPQLSSVKLKNGDSAIEEAVKKGHGEIVQILISSGVNPKEVNENGRTLLHLASVTGQFELVKMLIETYGLDPRARDHEQATALHEAAAKGNFQIVEYLMERDPSLITATTKSGRSPLHAAAASGALSVVTLLVEKYSANIHVEMVPEIESEPGDIPFHLACVYGHADVVSFFLQRDPLLKAVKLNNGNRPVDEALINKNSEVVKLLLTIPIYIDVDEKMGFYKRTLLHTAAANGDLNIVKTLVEEFHCDTTAKDVFGETPLELAKIYENDAVIEYIRHHQIDEIIDSFAI